MTASESGDWYAELRTSEDIAGARAVLMAWAEHTGDVDAAARMAEEITARALSLGLEPA